LLMISQTTTDGYESKSITGAEIIASAQDGLQPTLVSGTNIKTVNDTSLLGSGNVAVQPTLVSGTNIKTINGNTLLGSGDLTISGGGGLTIGTTAITSGTIGRVLFQGTGNVLQQSTNLFWDNTNGRFGINTALPNMALDIRTGNVGIGVTSDAGYKLDVNGTARVQNTLTVASTSSNGALSLTQNTVGNVAQYINRANTTNCTAILSFQDLKAGVNNRSFSLGMGRSGDPQWTNGDFIFGYYSGSGSWQQSAKIFNASGNWAIENGTATSDITTAILQVNSTTKGFLPPRMTTTQKNAIASPASGLIVYDTTLNKLCVYTTTWETITSV
jgi:hypothetical protein